MDSLFFNKAFLIGESVWVNIIYKDHTQSLVVILAIDACSLHLTNEYKRPEVIILYIDHILMRQTQLIMEVWLSAYLMVYVWRLCWDCCLHFILVGPIRLSFKKIGLEYPHLKVTNPFVSECISIKNWGEQGYTR